MRRPILDAVGVETGPRLDPAQGIHSEESNPQDFTENSYWESQPADEARKGE